MSNEETKTDVKTDVETKVETKTVAKLHKVKFISTLYTFDFKYNQGDVAEVTDEVYAVCKKYNSIEDV